MARAKKIRKLLDTEFGFGGDAKAVQASAKADFGEDITLHDAGQIVSLFCTELTGSAQTRNGSKPKEILSWFVSGRWRRGS